MLSVFRRAGVVAVTILAADAAISTLNYHFRLLIGCNVAGVIRCFLLRIEKLRIASISLSVYCPSIFTRRDPLILAHYIFTPFPCEHFTMGNGFWKGDAMNTKPINPYLAEERKTVVCAKCGKTKHLPLARFCTRCGTPLPEQNKREQTQCTRPRFSYEVTTTCEKTTWNFSPGVIGRASSLCLKRMPNGGVNVLLNGHKVNDVIAYNVELGRASMPSITIKVALSDASVDAGIPLEFDGKKL